MNILLVGGGGREHALAWKLAQSTLSERVYVAPGNAGTAAEEKVENIPLEASDFEALRDFALQRKVELVLVGPEAPLADGIVEYFQQRGLAAFAPTRAAVRLETSKWFAKQFMRRHRIPTAASEAFDDVNAALGHLKVCRYPTVVKADGLAAGKGVAVVEDYSQAASAARGMLSGERFGDAGRRIVVEEFLRGEEVSFICMVSGEQVLPLAASRDHKTRDEGGRGPNTGGMGAYSPSTLMDAALQQRVMRQVVRPTVAGMCEEGTPFLGFLYAGLMIDGEGSPTVLEFNCRLGDPETQPVLMRLRSDLVELCDAALNGRLSRSRAEWDERVALGVVMAAQGYPGACAGGDVIHGLEAVRGLDATRVFHAGTRLRDGAVVTAGGRVLCVTALADTMDSARARAYEACEKIDWRGKFYRRDIGCELKSG